MLIRHGAAWLVLVVIVGCASNVAIPNALGDGWTPDIRDTAIAGCRQSLLASSFRDYLIRRGRPVEQIPTDPFRLIPEEKRAAAMLEMEQGAESVLAVCDCTIGIVSKELSFPEFERRGASLDAKVQEIKQSGACPQAEAGSN